MPWQKYFLRKRTGQRSSCLAEVYRECTREERQLSSSFYARYLAGRGMGRLTSFEGIEQGPGIFDKARELGSAINGTDREEESAALLDCLSRALTEQISAKADPVAVAVSGGVDSWLLVAILKFLGYQVQGFYLYSGMAGYCEREQVARFSEALRTPCEYMLVTAADFLRILPEFLAIAGAPIYNLHPVSKLLLARGLQERGIRTVVTGDGADQVMRHDWDCDLLPFTSTCFEAVGVQAILPFLSPRVIALCRTPDREKKPVRLLAHRFSLPSVPKEPTLFPEIPLPAGQYELLPVTGSGGSEGKINCLRYTTGLLRELLEGSGRFQL